MRVGIFDSGIGGLSVLHQALRMMPGVDFLYYADEEHVPYGEKTRRQIWEYIDGIIGFMLENRVDAIVIACNTATSVATKEYRGSFPVPIIGMEPAVKRAVELYHDAPGRILVAATPVTIAGEKLHDLLEKVDREENVDLVALPELVRLAEKGAFETEEAKRYLRGELGGYPLCEYKAFVLGCTHFNYFKALYRRIFPEGVHLVDGNEGTIRQLMRKLPGGCAPRADKNGGVEYYFSGKPVGKEDSIRIRKYMEQLAGQSCIHKVVSQDPGRDL